MYALNLPLFYMHKHELHFLMIHKNFYASLVSVLFLMMAQKWTKYLRDDDDDDNNNNNNNVIVI